MQKKEMAKQKLARTVPPGRSHRNFPARGNKRPSAGVKITGRQSEGASGSPRPARAERTAAPEPQLAPFRIVGIGASAGGLEAFTRLLQHLPADSGMGFVFIPHLDPTHESLVTEILARTAPIPIVEVKHGTAVEPDHVYVIPPNKTLSMADGLLCLAPRTQAHELHLPIDAFFDSRTALDSEQPAASANGESLLLPHLSGLTG
ncbi:MAG: chemotaxis protein CheB [Acidimicrobiia bacterium]